MLMGLDEHMFIPGVKPGVPRCRSEMLVAAPEVSTVGWGRHGRRAELPMRLWDWLGRHDRDYAALRRAGRTAILMPAMFAFGDKGIDNAALATFAAFGTFAMLLLVDFPGPIRSRLQAQAALGVAGCVLVVLGTLASRNIVVSVVAMALVAFAILFAGVVSSVLAAATTSMLLAFILPVSLPGDL